MKLTLVSLFVLLVVPARLFSQLPGKDSLKNIINPDSVYFNVDIPAEHPKGKDARIRFIEKNIDAATPIKNGAPSGIYKIRIACIIDTAGKFTAMVPETNEGYGMEKEMMRVLKNLPAFKPAIKNGVAVKSKIVFPVTFMSRKAD
jgi:periplasmic protein TonB